MSNRSRFVRWALVGVLLLASSASQAQQRVVIEEEEQARPKYPILQYSVAVLLGGVAMWSVLRSSRRGWTS